MRTLIVFTIAFPIIAGCATSNRPDWVRHGSGVYADQSGMVITGVGMAPANPNVAFRNQTAVVRARQELQKQIVGYVPTIVAEFGEFCKERWGDPKAVNTQTGAFPQFKKAVAVGVAEGAMRYAAADQQWESPDGSVFLGVSVPMRAIRVLTARHILLPQNRGMMGERFGDEAEMRGIVDAYFEKSAQLVGASGASPEDTSQ
ncbi:MAG TPA: hypothetical protein PL033_06380 [Candidatus Brocadiia bacterium]|nr:hypothetical protein [Candidatus Brocadiia bacterium]